MKKWQNPILNDLSVNHTNESIEHYAVDNDSRSTWLCSCGNTFNSREELRKHIDKFWDDSTNDGTEHWEKQLS
ncbi:hypothetical protein [Turicibacter sanguinis]|uniref:hypothetical protein n=1 Tax=Turicibacter sanguinis TaxID=154288 RepID=UPI0018AA9D4C|nr:hypothetical protein [Turicibacter sanguinis]MDB8558240.1 hypothetical protein [Turicibacter sanguinis]MDB8561016.1 hypothetical protein [Turicibacter sanguinis]